MNPMEQFMNSKNADLAGSTDGNSPNGEAMVEDDKTGQKTGKLTFNKPSGFKLPEGVQEGEAFDAMATLKLVNGKLVLDELDGTPVEDEHESEESDDEENESDGETSDQDESSEPKSSKESDSSDEDTEPSTEEPEADDEGEPADFLSAIEKKAKKLKK